MSQVHEGFIADMLKHCERGEHPPLTVWEVQQLLTLAQRALASAPQASQPPQGAEPEGGCPCLLTEPCGYACSCANPFMSGGCLRCCKYGSLEQRKRNAERLAASPLPAPQEPADWSDQVEQRLLTWRQRFVNKSGDQLALDDFMGQESIDDLIDFVCAPLYAAPAPVDPESQGSSEPTDERKPESKR